MNAQDAQLLTMETTVRLAYYAYGYEMYEGDILYSFIPSPQLDTMIDDIMRDPSTLCVWMDSNSNGIVSSKIKPI